MSKVVDLAARKAAKDTEAAFVVLLGKDIQANPDSVTPLSRSVFDRIDALEAKARANQEADRIEC